MNKKITPKIIKSIIIQALIVMVAVTAVGAASTVHNEYKNTAVKKEGTSETTEDKTGNSAEVNKTEPSTEKTPG